MAKRITAEQLATMGLDEPLARELSGHFNQLVETLPPGQCWTRTSQEILTPALPFQLHWLLYQTTYADWDHASQGMPPAWIPTEEFIRTTNIAQFMEPLGLNTYEDLHSWSVRHRDTFWDRVVQKLDVRFKHDYSRIVDLSLGPDRPRWLVDAKLNIADSCFVADGDCVAIVYRHQKSGRLSTLTYAELDLLTNRLANGLAATGFRPDDAIAVAMPMTVESVVIYLGIVKAGCVVVSIADSFAPPEIEKRIRLGNARGIFTQDYVRYSGKELPMYEKIKSANAPRAVVLSCGGSSSVNLRDGDLRWDDFLSEDNRFESVSREPDDHTNVLFSSGTTGEPKAIPWTHTTPIKCAMDGYLHHNIQPGDVVAWPTNLGWMMGPWLIYASLFNRATIALYGDAPTGRGFGQFVQDAKVAMLGVVPSLVKAWKNSQCMKGLDWSNIKAFSSTGESSNAEDMLFLMSQAEYKPVIEYCGGTEIGGGYIAGTVVQPASPATFTTAALGLDLVILDETGQPTDNGELFLVPPSMGLSAELLNQNHHEVYFEGVPKGPHGGLLRRHGDQMERLTDSAFRAHGRADDTMNLGGIKVSSAEIERVLNSIDGISETAAIAVSPEDEGPSTLVVYAVLLEGSNPDMEGLKDSLQQAVRQNLNPLFKIHDVVLVDSLPRTASNKVMRRQLRVDHKSSSP